MVGRAGQDGETIAPGNSCRVLLLTLAFSPDGVSTATLMSELATQLHNLGDQVSVFTTTPHYNEDAEVLASQPLTPKWGDLLFESRCGASPVYHARVHRKGNRVLGRLIDYSSFHALSTLAGLRLGGKYEVVLAPSPPLTIGLSAALLAGLRRVPFVYNVQEIYPDIAVSLGVLRHGAMVRAMEWMEQFIYRRADAVVVISESFRQRLLAKGVPDGKLHVIPNFVDVNFMKPGERSNCFSQQHRLEDRFVIMYAGNIGLAQDFETTLAAAAALKDLPEIEFVIVGDGARREWLARQMAKGRVSNIRLLPYQPHRVVPLIYASSDLCLVPMRRGTASSTFPSKIYTIMAAGRPAIVCAEPESELTRVVQQSGCGYAMPPGDAPALEAGIREAYSCRNDLAGMGRAGRQYVAQHHQPASVARKYHELLTTLARKK